MSTLWPGWSSATTRCDYLVAGADRTGNLLELVVLAVEDDVLVIHAMALRRSTREELFGDDR